MNRENIIRIAHESHLDVYGLGTDYAKFADALERFAALIASAERERIKQANAPEIERVNAYIKELEDALAQTDYKSTSDYQLMENAQGELERIKLVQTGVGIEQRAEEAYEAAKQRSWIGVSDEVAQPEEDYKRGYADAMNWKVQNHLEHFPPKGTEQAPMNYYRADAEGNLERTDIYFAQPERKTVAVNNWPSAAIGKETLQDAIKRENGTPPQRTWVEIDGDDWIKALEMADFDKVAAFEFFENKIKELNT